MKISRFDYVHERRNQTEMLLRLSTASVRVAQLANPMSRQPWVDAIDSARDIAGVSLPEVGWLRTAREALGMSRKAMSQRLGVPTKKITQLEREEVKGEITLKALNEAAETLGYRVEYALVASTVDETGWPVSAEVLVHEQAERIARRAMRETETEFEGSQTSYDRERKVQNLITALTQDMPRSFWDDSREMNEARATELRLADETNRFRTIVLLMQDAKIGAGAIAQLLGLRPSEYRRRLHQIQNNGVLNEPLNQDLSDRIELIEHEMQTAVLRSLVNARGQATKESLMTTGSTESLPVSRQALTELLNQMHTLQRKVLGSYSHG